MYIYLRIESTVFYKQDGELLKLRAFAHHRMGKYQLAINDYTASIAVLEKEKKNTFEPCCNRGNCYRLLGKITESIGDLESASAMNLTNAACRVCQQHCTK